MSTLNKTGGATIVVSTSSVQYYGNDVNQFFGGSSDRIAMLAFGAPSALGVDEKVSSALLTMSIKADTTEDYDNITLGLIDSTWGGGNSGFAGMYNALTGNVVTAPLSTSLSAGEVSVSVLGLLQTWAANPTAYSGIYLRCPTLSLARVGASGCSITYETLTQGAVGAPTSITISGEIVEHAPTMSWSGATSGTNNDIIGFEIGYAESIPGTYGTQWGSWQTQSTYYTSGSSGNIILTLPSQRGLFRQIRIRTLGSASDSIWLFAGIIKYNMAPGEVEYEYPPDGYYVYNKNTRILVTVSYDGDNHLMTIEVPDGYPPLKFSSEPPFYRGQRIIMQRNDEGGYGAVDFSALARDSFGIAGPAETLNVSVLMPKFIVDEEQFKGAQIKAEHINDLRIAIIYLTNSYGVELHEWAGGEVEAGTTPTSDWKDHVEEMRAELDKVIEFINDWDVNATDCLVPVPEWIPITGTHPRADVMEQLRSVIASI